ncbi:MAG: hypothetical protein MHPSP_003324, partial [Paramarteilia canceri]
MVIPSSFAPYRELGNTNFDAYRNRFITKQLTKSEIKSKCDSIKVALDSASRFLTYEYKESKYGELMKNCYIEISYNGEEIQINQETKNVAEKIGDATTYFYQEVFKYSQVNIRFIANDFYDLVDLLKIEAKIYKDVLPKAIITKDENDFKILPGLLFYVAADVTVKQQFDIQSGDDDKLRDLLQNFGRFLAFYFREIVEFYSKHLTELDSEDCILTDDLNL